MKTVKPRRVGKRLPILLLVLVFCYPGITASHADFPTSNELFKQILEESAISPTEVEKTTKKALVQRRKKALNPRQAGMLYYFWLALKHNRPG